MIRMDVLDKFHGPEIPDHCPCCHPVPGNSRATWTSGRSFRAFRGRFLPHRWCWCLSWCWIIRIYWIFGYIGYIGYIDYIGFLDYLVMTGRYHTCILDTSDHHGCLTMFDMSFVWVVGLWLGQELCSIFFWMKTIGLRSPTISGMQVLQQPRVCGG